MKFTCVALFCDDIREEASGMQSLMGIWPDYIKLEAPPPGGVSTTRFGVYIRTLIPINERPEIVKIRLEAGDETIAELATLDLALIEKTIAEARRGGMPNAGFISRILSPAFPVPGAPILFRVLARCGDYETIAGAAHLEPLTSPTA